MHQREQHGREEHRARNAEFTVFAVNDGAERDLLEDRRQKTVYHDDVQDPGQRDLRQICGKAAGVGARVEPHQHRRGKHRYRGTDREDQTGRAERRDAELAVVYRSLYAFVYYRRYDEYHQLNHQHDEKSVHRVFLAGLDIRRQEHEQIYEKAEYGRYMVSFKLELRQL